MAILEENGPDCCCCSHEAFCFVVFLFCWNHWGGLRDEEKENALHGCCGIVSFFNCNGDVLILCDVVMGNQRSVFHQMIDLLAVMI